MLGDSVEVTEGYRTWWSRPALHRLPWLCVRLRLRQLLALSVYQRYEQPGEELVPRYLETALRRGIAKPRGDWADRRRRPRRSAILDSRA